MYMPQEIIRLKRDGKSLNRDQIYWFSQGIADHSITDSQVAAFAMACYFQGMSVAERTDLTCALRDSGDTMQWQDKGLSGPVIDKHSTGGLGDLTSLVLGPMLAACGAHVPMISGRGLGHTGGTLDKLESIPGYNIQPTTADFIRIVRDIGVAIIGQTGQLAPADKRLYGIRDVTATVDSIDLITASILGKKLAEGLDALVMDVKVGSGAFMPDLAHSKRLAEAIAEVSESAGVPCVALLTDMNQSLAPSVGNAVEIRETLKYLKAIDIDSRLMQVTLALASELLVSAKLAENIDAAEQLLRRSLESGAALKVFGEMVAALGGPVDFVEKAEEYLPQAAYIAPLCVSESAYLAEVDCQALGMALVSMGGGRTEPNQSIDHSVGFTAIAELGDYLKAGESLLTIHAKDQKQWQEHAETIMACFKFTDDANNLVNSPIIYQRISV